MRKLTYSCNEWAENFKNMIFSKLNAQIKKISYLRFYFDPYSTLKEKKTFRNRNFAQKKT